MDHGPATQESADPSAPDATIAEKTPASSRRRERQVWRGVPGNWPLLVILVAQVLLSLRLVRADTAFQDEALYLWAGHLEWAHVLHGVSLPPFPAYFSGAPVIYPPLGALADSVGGLTGARILSLVFMLGTTTVLWFTAEHLFGRRAAFFATALFATLSPTLHLGAFATYDAMSLFLLSLAAWCAARAGDRADATGWMVAAGITLALANATSYPTALFDPVVILIALIVALPKPGGRLAAGRALSLLAITALLITAGLLIGGSRYIHGVDATTLTRVPGTDSPLTVFTRFFSWTGAIVVTAVAGAVMSWVARPRHPQTWLLTLLAVAALLVPVQQALLSTTASLNKHGDLGAWFAAMAAGYAVDRVITASPVGSTRTITTGACVVALSFPVTIGVSQSREFSTDWPDSAAFVAIFRALADQGNGHLLVEDPSIAEYYLPSGSQWKRWSSTRNIVRPSGAPTGGPSSKAGIVGAGNSGTFGLYIGRGYFSVVALNFGDTSALDQKIAADLRSNPHYRKVQVVPYGLGVNGQPSGRYVIWRYEPKS